MFNGLTNKEFVQQLRHLKPNKSYNREVLDEISKREIKNNLYVVHYLKELENLNICNYERHAALLNQFEVSDRSSKFLKFKRIYEEFTPPTYDFKKVVYSIKNRNMSPDLTKFTNCVEKILESTKTKSCIKEEETCIIKIETNQKIISDFINLVQRFRKPKKTKLDIALLQDIQQGSLTFKESWFDFFKGSISTASVLFVFYFICVDNAKSLKYQILKSMIVDLIGGIDLRIFEETEKRFTAYLENNSLFESNDSQEDTHKGDLLEGEEKEEEVIKKETKANKNILEWYREREEAFTKTK